MGLRVRMVNLFEEMYVYFWLLGQLVWIIHPFEGIYVYSWLLGQIAWIVHLFEKKNLFTLLLALESICTNEHIISTSEHNLSNMEAVLILQRSGLAFLHLK